MQSVQHLINPITITFAGLCALLVAASLVSLWGIKTFPGTLWNNIYDRVKGWWQIVGVLLLSILLGKNGTLLVFAATSFLALREFISIVPSAREDHRALLWIFFVIVPLQYLLLWSGRYGLFTIFIPVYGFVLLTARNVASYHKASDISGITARVSVLFMAQIVCVYCVSHVPALLNLDLRETSGARMMLFLMIITQLSDVLQFVCGKAFGKTKIAPAISPNKTSEGLLGGVILCVALSPLLGYLTGLPWHWNMVLAFLATVLGFYGGLFMSTIKRDHKVKDWGHVIPGHGGVLDRIDSMVFSAPIFFHIVRYFFT